MQNALLVAGTRTLFHLLQEGAVYLKKQGIPSPRLEAELILSNLLSLKRIDLYLSPEKLVSPGACRRFQKDLERRAAHVPLQYITGYVEFCGLSLIIRPGVFIPRPETELIVKAAKRLLPQPTQILDLCTGSGALAIALAQKFPSASIVAIDVSESALFVAADNVKRHCLTSRVTLLKGDLFEPVESRPDATRFDLIVCNPPYISEKERPSLPPEVRDYEPETALFSSDEGRSFYRRILREAPRIMSEAGVLLLELGAGQSAWFQGFVEENTNLKVTFIRDWAGINRIAHVSKWKHSDG